MTRAQQLESRIPPALHFAHARGGRRGARQFETRREMSRPRIYLIPLVVPGEGAISGSRPLASAGQLRTYIRELNFPIWLVLRKVSD